MRGILLAFLAASAGLFSVSGQRPDRVEPGRIETVVLDETGSAVLRVDIDHPGVPAFDIFSAPPSVTQLRLSLVEDAEALKAPEGIPILPAGRHDLLVSAAEGYDGGPAEIQGRLRIDPALDAFEPNDTPDAAAEIDLPFHRIVRPMGSGTGSASIRGAAAWSASISTIGAAITRGRAFAFSMPIGKRFSGPPIPIGPGAACAMSGPRGVRFI